MSNIFSRIFGGGKKAEAVNVLSPIDTPEGARYKKTLEERLAGLGVGFSPEVLSTATNPYAVQRRANLANYEVPLISAQASARGLGRSTIPVNRIALSGQEAETDIGNKIAQLQLANEQQKRSEIADALNKYGVLTGDITAAENAKRQAAANASEAARVQDIATTQAAGLFGAQMLSPLINASLQTGISALSDKNTQKNFSDAFNQMFAGGDNKAAVNILGKKDQSELTTILMKLLAAGGA